MALTFDGANKRITLSSGTTSLDVKDLWSRWVDWVALSDNSKYLPAFDTVGGNPIDASAGTSIPIYCFMKNGWRIKPQEASHTLNVSGGVLLVDGGGDPFVNPDGSFAIRINYSQPVQAITVATGGGSGAPTASQNAEAVWGQSLENGLSAQEIIKLLASLVAAKTSGGGSSTVVFRDLADTKNRIVATVDSNGNRSNVTIDAS